MVSVELLAGLLLAYTLLYLLISYFLRHRLGDGNGSQASSTPSPHGRASTSAETDSSDATASSVVVCGVCRAENDPGYTYCRSCISELGASHDRASRSP